MLQKTKTVKLMDFQGNFCMLASSFHSYFYGLIFILHSNSFSDIFLSPYQTWCFIPQKKIPLSLPCFLHIAVQTQKASLALLLLVDDRLNTQDCIEGPLYFAFLFSVISCKYSFNFTQLLLQSSHIRSAKTHHFYFTLFAFTVVPTTSLAGF